MTQRRCPLWENLNHLKIILVYKGFLFQIGFFTHFYFKWCHIKANIFRIIFCVPSWSLVHTVNGISRQGLYREWTRQAGLSFYSKPMQTEWIVATVQRECLFVGLSGLYYWLKIVLLLVLKIISPSLLQSESFRNQHKNLSVIISRALSLKSRSPLHLLWADSWMS